MNPIKVSQSLHEAYVSYLTTTFDVNRSGQNEALARAIRRSFNRPNALFRGPFLELTPPYKTGKSLVELAEEGVITPKLLQLPCFSQNRPLPPDAPLYTHQEKAIRKLCANHEGVVISSGTGSGKTEGFLIPILNDLLLDPTPGVRAVLIYPMNALVNDQLDRLRILLRGTEITFGRYTSELENKAADARHKMQAEWEQMSKQQQALLGEYPLPNEIIGRDQIREQGHLPQILITNYAMLEYLLLRPVDNPLFAQGRWRFIVLDEAHSYAGAQGIEVGMLMRRLKHRLRKQPGETLCIATSATLTNDDAGEAAAFAQALFGETFTTDDIIFGNTDEDYVPKAAPSYQPPAQVYLHPKFEALLKEIRQAEGPRVMDTALLMEEIGLITVDDLSEADTANNAPAFLWQVLQRNEDVQRLRSYMAAQGAPVTFADVAAYLFSGELNTEEEQKQALYHLVELAAMGRPDVDKASLLPVRYHLFARPPQGLWVCLNPTCEGKEHQNDDSAWSRLYTEPRERCESCNAAVYSLTVCRTCGQPYLRMEESDRRFLAEADQRAGSTVHYMTWAPVEENRALGSDEESLDDDEALFSRAEGNTPLSQEELILCLNCQQQVRNGRCSCGEEKEAIHVVLYDVVKEEKKGQRSRKMPVEEMNECPRCRDRSYVGTEIVTPLSMGTMTPLSIMTQELYQQLPVATAPHIGRYPGQGRKLLSFYDSRQGAARFAAFLQDAVNQNTYNHLIPVAIRSLEERYGYADFPALTEKTMEMALENRIFHNDVTINSKDLRDEVTYLTIVERERLERPIRARVLAQFTTGSRSRLSLETLCLAGVFYAPPGREPDISALAAEIGLSTEQTWTLISYLLDDLRRSKVVTLPEGVNRDDPIFGRNKFSPGVVRSNPTQYQVAWIGKTARHRRRRLVKKALAHAGQPRDEENVLRVLEKLWMWLTRPDTGILDISRPADGFQIRHDRLIFRTDIPCYQCSQCLRYSYRGDSLPCPHSYCEGTLAPVCGRSEEDNFYVRNYQADIVPMRVEEHTAQLTSEKGREYQEQFKNGQINVLSCSTTFEMGIDLGDLQSVVMSNIPPTVSNYKQRAGRAGRRASGTAFILAWASDRPHDQAYFKEPPQLISGRIRVPHIKINNQLIIQRHVNAILLSEFLRYQQRAGRSDFKQIRAFFDPQADGGPHYDRLPHWLKTEGKVIQELLGRFASRVAMQQSVVEQWVKEFKRMLRKRGAEQYQQVTGYYKQMMGELMAQMQEQMMSGDMNVVGNIQTEFDQFRRLLQRVQKEKLIDYLSDKGVLPSYSFPLYTVDLRVYDNGDLRLQRDLRQAIREYAPGQEIVANKRIWKSGGLDFFGKEPVTYHYRICPVCNHLDANETPGQPLANQEVPCPVCDHIFRGRAHKVHQFIVPDGFRTNPNQSGQPAGQYVKREANLTRSALLPGGTVDLEPVGELLEVGYDRQGKLLYVNEGYLGSGFNICMKCGKALKKPGKCDAIYRGEKCQGIVPRDAVYTLGFMEKTDTLHLRFRQVPTIQTPPPEDQEFWLSLKYALLHGASHALQIERNDIDGVLFPRGADTGWRQTVVLYDNVPGGAGHVKRIQEEIRIVVGAALDIIDCDCAEDTSCYRCLRDYSNQWEHHLLVRGRVISFLRALYASLNETDSTVPGRYDVAATDLGRWLAEQIEDAQQEVVIVAERLAQESPNPHYSWPDILHALLLRNVSVRLYLAERPDPKRGDLSSLVIAEQLRALLTRGLVLEVTKRPAPWQVLIDAHTELPRAIQVKQESLVLDKMADATGFFSTTHRQAVREIRDSFADFSGRRLDREMLRLPPEIVVMSTHDRLQASEAELFGELFAEPVVSLQVNDRYLKDEETIVNRLGAYLRLAGNTLQKVTVRSYPADHIPGASLESQSRAIQSLKRLFPDVEIDFKRTKHTEHDRFIIIERGSGSLARILIGKGLDFIKPDGSVSKTFIVIEDPYEN